MNTDATATDKYVIRTFGKKSTARWALAVLFDWLVIGASLLVAVRSESYLAAFAALWVVGNRQHAIAVLGHEGAHYTIHSSKALNDFLSDLLCFWPLLITTEGYRALHFKHHRNTGTKDDPELMHKKARAPQWNLPMRPSTLASYALKDLFGYSLPDLAIILTFSKPEKPVKLVPVLVLHGVFLAVASQVSWLLPMLWYGALATTFMVFFRLRLWFEHQATFETQRVALSPAVAAVFAPHNIWLHWEHHRWPTIPFDNLPRARQAVAMPVPLSLEQLIRLYGEAPVTASGAHREEQAKDDHHQIAA